MILPLCDEINYLTETILQCFGSPEGAGLLNGYPCLILDFISAFNWTMAFCQDLLSVSILVYLPILSLQGWAVGALHWQYPLLFQIAFGVHGGACCTLVLCCTVL